MTEPLDLDLIRKRGLLLYAGWPDGTIRALCDEVATLRTQLTKEHAVAVSYDNARQFWMGKAEANYQRRAASEAECDEALASLNQLELARERAVDERDGLQACITERYNVEMNHVEAERDVLLARITAALALHKSRFTVGWQRVKCCAHCSEALGLVVPYPCPTVRTLEGNTE